MTPQTRSTLGHALIQEFASLATVLALATIAQRIAHVLISTNQTKPEQGMIKAK